MMNRMSSFLSLFSRKNNNVEVFVERGDECESSKNLSEVEHPETFLDVDGFKDDVCNDGYDPYEVKYDVFTELVKGTRYEQFAGKT